MLKTLAPLESIAGRADVLPPAFECSWSEDGLDAAWVRLAGELDIATTPQLERAERRRATENGPIPNKSSTPTAADGSVTNRWSATANSQTATNSSPAGSVGDRWKSRP